MCQINPKHNELLAFTISNISSYPKALAAAISFNLDPLLKPNLNLHLISTVTSTPTLISLEYAEYADISKNKEIPQLLPHRPSIDYET